METRATEKTPAGSRDSLARAGWSCQQIGTYRQLLPHGDRPFSWINPAPLWRSRNDKLARVLGDPTNDMRKAWVAQLGNGAASDFTISDHADCSEISVLVLGDTGEGDGSQYALVPGLLNSSAGTAFMFVLSDVIYPAGGINAYQNRFHRPYKDYPAAIYAIPGNHDWYDDLTGFLFTFCNLHQPPPRVTGPGPGWKRVLRRLFWRHAPKGRATAIERMRALRPAAEQRRLQPGPYLAIEAGPILLVGIDTGITGELDREQGEWLRRVSGSSAKPKILLTGKPLYVNGEHRPGRIEHGGTVDEIVRNPEHNYIATIGGDVHNYQRYPVTLEDGRTIQYIVSGGGGAFMNETHKIPHIDHAALAGVTEADFRCYPLRGDSLSVFSRNYGRFLGGGMIGHWLGIGRLISRLFFIPPDQAAAIMAERLGLTPARPSAREVTVSRRARLVSHWIFPLPGQVHGLLQPIYTELLDWNDPPMFKNFLRLDATNDHVRVTCFAVTGCLEHEQQPPVEDLVTASRDPAGRWTWTTGPLSDSMKEASA